jgi:ribosomal protein S18 acetylase RimI-like enzyme
MRNYVMGCSMLCITSMNVSDLDRVNVMQHLSYPPGLHEDMTLFKKIILARGSLCLVGKIDEVVEGYVIGYPAIPTRDDFERGYQPLTGQETVMYLHDLCINPEKRGLYIARDLVQAFEEETRERGFEKILAVAIEDALPYWLKQNYRALEAYEYRGHPARRIEKNMVA